MRAFCLRRPMQPWFYNQAMRATLLFTLCLATAGATWAQATVPRQAASAVGTKPATASGAPVEQRAERIHVEDAGARIDELRIGGETKTITVQPKGGMPAYQIQPGSGERSWKIANF
jgi:hypothetical protein